MDIIDYTYRKPKYLDPLSPTQIDTTVIHHTSNYNSLDANTDYHIDHNAWNWNGYGYYITKGTIYKIRGMEYQNAATRRHNHHTVNIAIEGNYDIDHLIEADKKALEWLINYLKEKNPNIKYLKGHNEFGNTSCPGKNINVKLIEANIKKETIDYDTIIQDNEILKRNNRELIAENERLDRIIRKDREKHDDLKRIYKEKVKELHILKAKK